MAALTASTKAMSWLGEMVVAKKIHCSATRLNKQVMTETWIAGARYEIRWGE